jgi:hypothetical protein
MLLATLTVSGQAEPRQRTQPNYILRRQQVVPGLGTPTLRRIIGKRQVDYYRNGMVFEKDHLVGFRR